MGSGTSRPMKTIFFVVLMLVGAEASACSLCTGGWGGGIDLTPSREARFTMGALAVAGVVAFATGSAFALAEGSLSRRWLVASVALGLVNVVAAGLYAAAISDEKEPLRLPLAALHGAVGAVGVLLPIVGLFAVTPIVFGGGGWTGAGVRVAF